MKVELKHCPNYDIPKRYWDGKPNENNLLVEVESLEDASRICSNWIEELGLGSGNWTGGKVFNGGKLVAEISYNGRKNELYKTF